MHDLATAIAAELDQLLGQQISDCWRAVDMQIFEFGPRHEMTNRKGKIVEVSDIRLHLQCRWRFVSKDQILFGQDDLYRSADPHFTEDFDYNKQPSALDAAQRAWFDDHRDKPLRVIATRGDNYGGFRIELESHYALECLPCDTSGEYWRMLGHRADGTHFVVTAEGIEDSPAQLS